MSKIKSNDATTAKIECENNVEMFSTYQIFVQIFAEVWRQFHRADKDEK